MNYNYLAGNHDLSLSAWGPFAHDFFTLSHVTDEGKGWRFDFLQAPGIYRRKVFPPETLRECEWAPTEIAADLSHYGYEQKMVPEPLSCKVTYSTLSNKFRMGRCEFCNHSDEDNMTVLYIFGRLHAGDPDEVVPQLPEGVFYRCACEHDAFAWGCDRCDTHLIWDGRRRGEEPMDDAVHHHALGANYSNVGYPGFGGTVGDRAEYCLEMPEGHNFIAMRFRTPDKQDAKLRVTYGNDTKEVICRGGAAFHLQTLFEGNLKSGTLVIESLIPVEIQVDGFVFGIKCAMEEISFVPYRALFDVKASSGPVPGSAIISSSMFEEDYGLAWSFHDAFEREYYTDDLARLCNYSYALRQPFYKSAVFGGEKEYCKEVFMLPIRVPAHGSKVIYSVYGVGRGSGFEAELTKWAQTSDEEFEAIYQKAHANRFRFQPTAAGENFRFGQERMAAVALTNIIFPLEIKGQRVRHHVPTRYYSSLYQWDSGFSGIGLAEIDKIRAIENLNSYVTEPDDDDCAFILHGTPLPVQAYLFMELWNRYQDRSFLEYFYPRMRKWYLFLAGHIQPSTVDKFKTRLLQTWDYFYNSGGWDDYPPQWTMYEERIFNVAPVVVTSNVIRFAKIMAMAAKELGKTDDLPGYQADIDRLADALQTFSYDKEDQIFSYVIHDNEGNFAGIYRDSKHGNCNFNFGLDGVSPLIAGICTPEQQQLFWDRLRSPDHMWSPYGISTVDRSAPYYRSDGYWNGGVWMPHQWFMWKAALDHNQTEFARRIALTALQLWERECERTGYCYEHFALGSGRGCMCHHFGALSSPVLAWYGAYYEKGRLTCGLDVWVKNRCSKDGEISAELEIAGNTGEFTTVLFVAGEGTHQVTFNGKQCPVEENIPGTLEITLPKNQQGTLTIR